MTVAVELATGYVSLSVSTRDLSRGVDKAGRNAGKKFGSNFGSAAKGLIGAAALLGAGTAAVGFFKSANAEAREAQKVGKTTAQIIKSTGGAAKISAGQVGDLATAISNKTGMDDEAIQSGANLLLTFKNVKNEVGKGSKIFDRATQSAADLSAAGFGSVTGASKMLGKALNDPIKGISALGRAGVTFTDQQKEQIKTLTESGDVLGAQKIILKEVESQVGGVAAASATAGEKFTVAFGNLKEQIGTELLPVVDAIADKLRIVAIPAVSDFVDVLAEKIPAAFKNVKDGWAGLTAGFKSGSGEITSSADSLGGIGERVGAAFHDILPVITPVFTILRNAVPELKPLAPMFKTMAGAVGGALKTALPIVADALAKIGEVLGKGLAVAIPKIADGFKSLADKVPGVADGFKSLGGSGGFIRDQLVPAVMGVVDAGKQLAIVVLPILKQIGDALLSAFKDNLPAIMDIFETVKGIVIDALGVIKGVIGIVTHLIKVLWEKNGAGILKAVKGTFGGIVKIIGGAMKIVGGIVKLVLAVITGDKKKAMVAWKQIWSGIKSVIVGIWRVLKNTVVALLKTLLSEIMTKWRSLLAWVSSKLKAGLAKIKDYILDPVRAARDKLKEILDQVANRFTSGVTAIATAWNKLKAKAKEPIRFIVNTVINDGLINAFNTIAKKVGAGTIDRVSLPKGFHGGGWTGPGAKMQAAGVVHADEFVVRKSSRRRIERQAPGALDYMNEHGSLPGYAGGGRVSYKGGTFTERFASRLRAVAQKVAFNVFQGGFRPTTSYSGTSHRGDAVDVGPVSARLVKALRSVNIAAWDRTGMGNWAPHIHGVPLPGAGSAAGSAVWQARDYLNGGNGLGGRDNGAGSGGPNKPGKGGGIGGGFDVVTRVINWGKRLKAKLAGALGKLSGAGSTVFGELGKGAARKVSGMLADKGKDWIQRITSKVKGAGSAISDAGVKGSNRARGLALMLKAGFGASQWPALNRLWTKESGWRTNANNPSSGAYGIPQSLPGSKMASAGSDWRTNPNTQIRWGLGYIKDRYGSPKAAMAHSARTNWYANGTNHAAPGLAWVGERGPELLKFRGGEKVINNKQSMAMAGSGAQIHQHFPASANPQAAASAAGGRVVAALNARGW